MNVRGPAEDPPNERAGRSYRSATTGGFRNDLVSPPEDRDEVGRPYEDPPVDRRGRSDEYPPRSDEEPPRDEVFVLLYIIILKYRKSDVRLSPGVVKPQR